jgi:uncharacterized membrane protein
MNIYKRLAYDAVILCGVFAVLGAVAALIELL